MTQIVEEAYVSFEVAKLMKEKGFEQKCNKYYLPLTANTQMWTHTHGEVIPEACVVYECPTQQMAVRWLIEQHNVHIIPQIDTNTMLYGYLVIECGGYCKRIRDRSFALREEAIEDALKYCLNFI